MIVNIQRLYYWPKIQPCPWASHNLLQPQEPDQQTHLLLCFCFSLQHIQWHHHQGGDRTARLSRTQLPVTESTLETTPVIHQHHCCRGPSAMGWLKLHCHLRQAQITALLRWQLPALLCKHKITIKYSNIAEAGTSFATIVLTDRLIQWVWGLCPHHLIHKLYSCTDFWAILTQYLLQVFAALWGFISVMLTASTAVNNRAKKFNQRTRKINCI